LSNAPKKLTALQKTRGLEDLRNKNLTRVQLLAQDGRGVHPLSLIQAHLSALVQGLGFDYELECEISDILDAAEEELRLQKLTEGLTLPNFGQEPG